jgi:hypothetical protein
MKSLKTVMIALTGAVVLAVASAPASAHGHYGRGYGPSVRFYIGPPLWGPYYWGPPPIAVAPPYGYYPPVVVAPAAPPVYVERDPESAPSAEPPAQWWYWCTNPQGYYPNVKECSVPWQRVTPQAPQR